MLGAGEAKSLDHLHVVDRSRPFLDVWFIENDEESNPELVI